MAFPSSVTDILATTIEARGKKVADNVTNTNALLFKLGEKGNIRTFSGGHLIREELAFAENANAGWYSGYDTLTVGAQDVISAAEFSIKQLAVPVTISGLEKLQNSGPNGLIDLMEARLKVAESTMKNYITEGLYSDGTGSGGKIITGLDAMLPADPTTGTYGTINRATAGNEFWRSQLKDNTAAAATILADMTDLWALCVRGTDVPDLITAGATCWKFFMAALEPNQRFTDSKMADAGFQNTMFMGAPVVLENNDGDQQDMYFINTNYVHYRPHADRNMVPLKPSNRAAVNQDAEVVILGWAGNLTTSGAKFSGRYKGD